MIRVSPLYTLHACTMHPSIHQFIHPSINPSIHPSIHPSVLPFIYPFIHPSVSILVNIDICKYYTSIYWNNRNANMWNNILCYVGNKAKGGISKRVFQENKEHKFSEKRTFLTPWYAHVGFLENLVGFFFWKLLFWDLPIALNIIISMFINSYQLFWQKLPSKIKKHSKYVTSPHFLKYGHGDLSFVMGFTISVLFGLFFQLS